jgi:ADP-heptose:LPS heptosyltransferase
LKAEPAKTAQFLQSAGIKKILAIRFMRLGDVTLLLPALAHLKAFYPESRLTLLTDERCAPLAEMCPSIDEVMTVNRLGMRDGPRLPALNDMAKLVADVRRRRFDLVIDFLSFRETNLLAWLSRAPHRLAMKRHDRAYLPFCFNLPPVNEDKSIHVAEMFQRIVNAVTDESTCSVAAHSVLVLPEVPQKWAEQMLPGEPVLSLYVGAPVAVRRWPAEHFARVADFAIEEFGATVAVLAGAPDAVIAREVRHLSRNPDQVIVVTDVSIPQLAAVIARSQLLVSNDTGPMHLGPAFGVPTLGLFSVGYPEHYRPLGEHSRVLRAEKIEEIASADVIALVKVGISRGLHGLGGF